MCFKILCVLRLNSHLVLKVFSLRDMEPDGYKIFRAARRLTHNIAFYLPRQTDTKEVCFLLKKSRIIL